MKLINKKTISLVWISVMVMTLIFPLFTQESVKEVNQENSKVIDKKSAPKISGAFTSDWFVIDELGGGNWTWSEAEGSQAWCSGSGILSDPYKIGNLTVDGWTTNTCITIENSKKYFVIENCTIMDSGNSFQDAGIKLENTTNGLVYNNTCNSLNRDGIILVDSRFNNISLNTIKDNIEVGVNLVSAHNNTFHRNILYSNYNGFFLTTSDNNTFIENNLTANDYEGMYLVSSHNNTILRNNFTWAPSTDGLWLSTSNDNIISENYITKNERNGILISDSDNNLIINNTISHTQTQYGIEFSTNSDDNIAMYNRIFDNPVRGISLGSGNDNNLFYVNNFSGNALHTYDAGGGNDWDNGTYGNWWDNYTGTDPDENGIGNQPYTWIHGGSSEDNFPLVWPAFDYTPPSITITLPTPSSLHGTTPPDYEVILSDPHFNVSWYSFDGGVNNEIFDTNSTIDSGIWSGLSNGSLTLSVFANDTLNNIDMKQVTFWKDNLPPIITILKPLNNSNINDTAPAYNITTTDPHLDHRWYQIYMGTGLDWSVEVPITTDNGTFDQAIWERIAAGNWNMTIRIFAIDTMGNAIYVDIILNITKSIRFNPDDDDDDDSGTSKTDSNLLAELIANPILWIAIGGIAGLAILGIYYGKREKKEKFDSYGMSKKMKKARKKW